MTPKEFTFDAAYQPQVRAKRGTREIMLDVIIALLPALCVGVWQFGAQALIPLAVSVVSCVFFEWAYRKLLKKPDTIGDLSAVVTGILLAFTLPANCKWWLPIIGAFFAIVIVKQLYGGIGKNVVNPALAARVFLFLSFSNEMAHFEAPHASVDAVASATPLALLQKGNVPNESLLDMFFGEMPGCLGEVSVTMLLLGGLYLLVRRVITWHIPVAFIGTVAILTFLFPQGGMSGTQFMLYELCSGGLMLGAFFMATDYVTSPVTPKGRLIYGIGCGLITVFIRYFGYPEGVSFAILVMNLFTLALDKFTMPVRFGGGKANAAK